MAYVDLVSTQLTPVQGGATYNFAFDTPISADGSPHLTHIGFQIDGIFGDAPTFTGSNIGRLISKYRLKVGSNTLIDFDDPAPDADAGTPSNLACIAAKSGGWEAGAMKTGVDNGVVMELTLPFGIDARKSHRINVSITLLSEADWCGQNWTVANTEFNMVCYYGISKDLTLYGGRQDFTLTTNSERAITVYGKSGWNMLGVSMINSSDKDQVNTVRTNNGAFRALDVQQWRVLDSTYLKGIRSNEPDDDNPNWVLKRSGYLFIDLKRLTAGADITMTVDANDNTTMSFFPIWVAPIGQGTGQPVRQLNSTVSSTSADVESQSVN